MENDHTDSFLLNDLDIDKADSEGRGERSDFEKSIRRIKISDTAYSVSQETQNFEKTWNEHLCSVSANEIDEKKLEFKDLPSHLEYAYLNGDRACLVQDVVKNEIVKLLDSRLIYPISDSLWVSPIHVVPKKGGMTVVLNDNNKPVPSRMVTG
ncbi:hypothetical protein Tco_0976968 [Tanacetum coccineum]|uniref:Reverse transcriptase domain-containing protein n=1 Tax=Tanacetum coccineum TaxID=301880 RepID=A0ABQ5EIQ3_9ASTR